MDESTPVTIENQYGVRFTVTQGEWVRMQNNPTNPLTLVAEKSPNGKKSAAEPKEVRVPAETSVVPSQEPEKVPEITVAPDPPPKKKAGRPKGSKTKRKGFQKKWEYSDSRPKQKRSRKPNIGKKIEPPGIRTAKNLEGFTTVEE